MDSSAFVTAARDGVVIDTFVQPRAAKDAIVGVHGSALKVKIKAPPLDDRANRAVESFFARLLDVPTTAVHIAAGRSSRHKRVAVAGVGADDVRKLLDGVLSCPAHERG